jgi:hypothetical protein
MVDYTPSISKLTSEQAVAETVIDDLESENDGKFFIFTEDGFSRQELVLMVELAYTLYEETGEAPTFQRLMDSIYRAEPRPINYEKIFKSEMFQTACSYRGIVKGSAGLTNKQMLTLRAVTNQLSRYSLDTKLKRLGVSQSEYKAWLRYPPFKRKLTELSTRALEEAESAGDVALAQQVTQGRLDAIKYADLRSGKYDPGRQQIIDVEYVMRQTIEIIQKHVKDPQALRNIGGELSLLAGAAGLDPSSSSNEAREVPENGNQLYT